MIALDTNLLVYAHREDSLWHAAAAALLTGLAEGSSPWAILSLSVQSSVCVRQRRSRF